MIEDTENRAQSHAFLGDAHGRNARKTWAVLLLCTAMMAVEIVAGAVFGSMALLADGFHMATHAGAMLVAVLAYRFAERHLDNPRFSFGTGKVGDLAAFGSAVFLAATAGFIVIESVERLIAPVSINFADAIPVAVVGLGVNLASLWFLKDDHGHDHHSRDRRAHGHQGDRRGGDSHRAHEQAHHHGDGGGRHDGHGDLNLRAAYVHVLTDAAVSVLAIIGLLAGSRLGWNWLDPVMGLIGAAVILRWSVGLAKAAGAVLLDRVPDGDLAGTVLARLEAAGAEVGDFHVWRLGPGHHGVIASLRHAGAHPAAYYHELLRDVPALSHVTIEVGR